MTRVLVLNERDPRHPKAGGAEVHLAELAPRLARRGFELTQLACSWPGASATEDVDAIHVRRLGRLARYYPRAASTCRAETRRGAFDVVVEILAKLPFYAPLYSRAPVLAVCHHLFGRTAFAQVAWPVAAAVVAAEALVPWLYRRAPFVAVSESTRLDLVRRGIAPEHIRVIPNGARQPDRDRPEPASPSGADDRPQRVVYLGRLEPYKQVDVLLRAMDRLAAEHPDTEVWIIGRGQDERRLRRLAARLGMERRVHFTGFVDEAERDALLSSARVCVCPSSKEGWGLTVIEANALGVPVVATNADGLRDSVRDGVTGLLAPDRDVDAFAAAIHRLLSDDALAARMSTAARDWSRRFDWEDSAEALADALERTRHDR